VRRAVRGRGHQADTSAAPRLIVGSGVRDPGTEKEAPGSGLPAPGKTGKQQGQATLGRRGEALSFSADSRSRTPDPGPRVERVGGVPLDHPTPGRPHRVYVALTNHCNRACPWCSTCSSPAGSTYLSRAAFLAVLPALGAFELQLEGGEPLLHPDFWELVQVARAHKRCTRLVLCTNGVLLPREAPALRAWLARLGEPLTVKAALNHHLIERDPSYVARCVGLRDRLAELGGDRALVINVRLRRGYADDDRAVCKAVAEAGLGPHANIFFLQRYGFASGEQGWEPPWLVWDNFTLVNPDGRVFGPDLLARSAAMGELP